MKLLIPRQMRERLIAELKRARVNEIGGILMGEHVGENEFRLKEITIQRRGGSFSRFRRLVPDFINLLRQFFASTNKAYTRFNYLGEWHSHPSFAPVPSTQDSRSMQEIAEDDNAGYFAVLLIVKLLRKDEIEGTVTVYQPEVKQYFGNIIWE